MISRRTMLAGLALGSAAGISPRLLAQSAPNSPGLFDLPAFELGMTLNEAQRQAGIEFLKNNISVDLHAHPGRFFLRDLDSKAMGPSFEAQAVDDIIAGQVSAVLFSCVSDLVLLAPSATRGLIAGREFAAGEAWGDYLRQIRALRAIMTSGAAGRGLTPDDIKQAAKSKTTACIMSVEGGDFIEDRLDRLTQAHGIGVRAITIVHYHTNQIGDPQTEAPVHGGLTKTGRSIVKEMNRLGIMVDLAHASFHTVRDAVAIATRPMMISHSNVTTPDKSHPRLITPEHGKLITAQGGLIGSVPSGIGQTTFADWIESVLRLIDVFGIDHVAIGTDMDANYRPVFQNYRDWSLIPSALLARGVMPRELAQIMGGNFLRFFEQNKT
jgi:membrane dipeptidase